ncbi:MULTISPECIES: GNAT family N-acetyltransferase [unclassified Streptomyces]|uniref:GNAT family N-acetyltransferase n=1 Tax=unclassified Streptomyces TaxID=2593676 RepID=UPI00068F1D46
MTDRLTLLLPEEARARRDELIALCAQAFAGPPWHEPPRGAVRTVDRLLGAAGRPGFDAAVALGPGDEILGFAAGWPDTVLSGGATAFEFAELVVAPAHQGRGLGRSLHDALMAIVQITPSLLMTLDVPELTDRYARWGWTVVDRRRPDGDPRDYVVMSRP